MIREIITLRLYKTQQRCFRQVKFDPPSFFPFPIPFICLLFRRPESRSFPPPLFPERVARFQSASVPSSSIRLLVCLTRQDSPIISITVALLATLSTIASLSSSARLGTDSNRTDLPFLQTSIELCRFWSVGFVGPKPSPIFFAKTPPIQIAPSLPRAAFRGLPSSSSSPLHHPLWGRPPRRWPPPRPSAP